jgi:hypothetical protein
MSYAPLNTGAATAATVADYRLDRRLRSVARYYSVQHPIYKYTHKTEQYSY